MLAESVLVVLLAAPLGAAIVSFVATRWAAAVCRLAAGVLLLALAALVSAVYTEGPLRYEIAGWGAPLGIDVYVDGLSAVMLILAATVASVAVAYAGPYLAASHHDDKRGSTALFWPLMMLLWTALNTLFVSRDLFNLYVALELLTLSAVALIGLAGTAEALVAALRYLLAALAGSLFYLLGVALMYSNYGVLDWVLIAANASADVPTLSAVALMTLALGLKTALFPLHFWLPGAHSIAPAPVSAILSGVVLKGSFYVLLRLWLFAFPNLDFGTAPGLLLSAMGAGAVLWGSAQAIRQRRAKLLLAYSSIAQVGYLFLAFSMLHGEAAGAAQQGAVYLALSHAFAKGAAFLAVGTIALSLGTDSVLQGRAVAQRAPAPSIALALAGASIMGLPPSGGFIGKWILLNVAMEQGRFEVILILVVGGLLAAMYFFKLLAAAMRTDRSPTPDFAPVPPVLNWAPLVLAILAILLGFLPYTITTILEVGTPTQA